MHKPTSSIIQNLHMFLKRIKPIDYLIYVLIILPWTFIIRTINVQSFTDLFLPGTNKVTSALMAWDLTNFGSNASIQLWRLPYSLFFYISCDLLKLPIGLAEALLLCVFCLVSFYAVRKVIVECFPLLKQDKFRWIPLVGGLFYIYNPFTLTQISSSFVLILPFLLLPLQILLLLSALREKKIWRFVIAFALSSGLVYGVNLIFDVLTIIVIIAFCVWKTLLLKEASIFKGIKFIVLGVCSSLLLMAFWLVPQVHSNLIDQKTTENILHSEDFYNNDSSVTNVLRGLGDWAFFGSQNGIPYNAFSVEYKNNFLIVIVGFILTGLAFLPSFFVKRMNRRERLTIISLYIPLVLVISFIGGTHASWPTAGVIAWMFANIPYFSAFRNTYKFASIQTFLIVLLTSISFYSLQMTFIDKTKHHRLYRNGMVLIVILLIVLNAFPFFTGKLFSTKNEITNIPGYWNEASAYINNTGNDRNAVFMLPDQYFEAFNWPSGKKNFPRNLEESLFKVPVVHNTCKGCGQYDSSVFISYIYKNLDHKNVFPALGQVGISDVMQRNDYDYGYYDVQSPTKIKSIIEQNSSLRLEKTFGLLDLYELDKKYVYPKIYSPNRLTATTSVDEIPDLVDQNSKTNDKYASVLVNQVSRFDQKTISLSDYYHRALELESLTVVDNKASEIFQVPKKASYTLESAVNLGSTNYRVSYQYVNGEYLLYLEPIYTSLFLDKIKLTNTAHPDGMIKTVNLGKYPASDIAIKVNDKVYLLLPKSDVISIGTVTLNNAESNIEVYRARDTKTGNLSINGSFDSGLWQEKVSNCRKASDSSKISMESVSDQDTNRSSILQLSSSEDVACISSLPLPNFQPGSYVYSFEARNVKGGAPGFCIWDGSGCVQNAKLDSKKNWQTFSGAVNMLPNSTNIFFYLYAERGNYTETINQYDNLQIYKVGDLIKRVPVTLELADTTSIKSDLTYGLHTLSADLQLNPTNLIENGSFKDGLWEQKVSKCSDAGNLNGMSMDRVPSGIDGAYALKLSSINGLACTSSSFIQNFSSTATYELSFKYKVQTGESAKVCVWDSKQCVYSEILTKQDDDWHKWDKIVQPKSDSQPLSIYFYADGTNKRSETLYTNVEMHEVENKLVASYILTSDRSTIAPTQDLSFNKLSDTMYEVKTKFSKQPSLIVLQQSFHPGWKAYVMRSAPSTLIDHVKRWLGMWPQQEVPASDHIVTNSFQNGWWFDISKLPDNVVSQSGASIVVFEYWPQRLVYYGLGVATITLFIFATCLYLGRKRSETNQKAG